MSKLHRAFNRCRCCGKALTDPTSVKLGIGPVCRVDIKNKHLNERSGNIFAERSEFNYLINGKLVAITDHGGMKSVTNDIENVLADIAKAENINLTNYRIMYKDSAGIWDGVIPSNPVKFFSLNERNYSTAKIKLLNFKL